MPTARPPVCRTRPPSPLLLGVTLLGGVLLAAGALFLGGCSAPLETDPDRPLAPASPAAPQPAAPAPAPSADPPPKPAQPVAPDEPAALAPPPLVIPAGPVENGEFGQVGPPIPISFDDLVLGIKPDVVFFRSMLTPRAKELEGKLVALRGYFDNDIFVKDGIKRFVLLRNTECLFGPGGLADHVIDVELIDDATAKYTNRPITVTGLLSVRPYTGFDGNTWAIYHIKARKVE